ncbi:hypothetical protein POF50_006135 [Streptomyces sp. SL13]|uniref:Uncharacterized protein n=1 Tax=Streptantibioticus silvisoli TaxID=2705255 RepID=A0AA90H061_9ACTN|nr:hypothetical protein [Streptantibioticus silvisoli]MDI5965403.1 hypothetical protein [Streptantibioticus silvisoli]MDI5968926.1 hypothetical protein [Streptantibioticus silvisoli]
MTQGWKVMVIVLGGVGIVSTPLIWLLNSPGAGELTGASIQGAVGVAALIWALFQQPVPASAGPVDQATRTGEADRGGNAGIKRPGGRGDGSARADRTGKASGKGSNTGIDYSE